MIAWLPGPVTRCLSVLPGGNWSDSMKCAILFLALSAVLVAQPRTAVLHSDSGVPQVVYAAGEIHRALADKGVVLAERDLSVLDRDTESSIFVIASGKESAARAAAALGLAPLAADGPETYGIRVGKNGQRAVYAVLSASANGAMYGGLDLAEAVRIGTLESLKDSNHTPYIAKRGIKFNIPLDVRNPIYTDAGDAGQQNIPEMWSFDFWREFLDELARHRYNTLTLWSMHPFPSLVRVPEYPDVALDDVRRTTVKLDNSFSFNGTDLARPEMMQKYETVRKMTISEKIRFWRDVMQYAHDRGIEVYLFTWNIFTFGTEGKYGITVAQDNPATIDYFRKSVRETVLTYPLLAGIGITAGEEMQDRKDEFAKEKWLWKTYGEGVRDALKLQPGRQFRMIHRYHQTALKPIIEEWKEYPSTFELSYKYSVAHMYSLAAPTFAKEALDELPANMKLWMTVRNDDIYSFRWGDPEYARAYVRALPGPNQLEGFYMGPDGYTWGREFISTEPETPRELVVKKQWFSFMLWGRLSYEPSLPDSLFERTLAERFPQTPAGKLLEASQEASRIIPQITRFFWGDIDLKWFPEGSLSNPRMNGFYTVRHFMEGQSMPGAGILNIASWRDRTLKGESMNEITPLQVAEALHRHAAATLKLVAGLRPAGSNKELRLTLGDYEAMAHLGDYYAEKILGAAQLALFDATGQAERKQEAVAHLQSALAHWKSYAAVATAQYKLGLLSRVGYVDLNELTPKVAEDVAMAENWRPRGSRP
jgi:hypothetical protein